MTTRHAPLDEQSIAALLDFADCPPLSGQVIEARSGTGSASPVERYLAIGARLYSSCPRCLFPLAPWRASESYFVDPTSGALTGPIFLCQACKFLVPLVARTQTLDDSLTPDAVDAAVCDLLLELEAARDSQVALLAGRLRMAVEVALRDSVDKPRSFVDFVLVATDDEVAPVPILSADLFAGISLDEETLSLSIHALVPPPHYAGSDLAPAPVPFTLCDKDVPSWQANPARLDRFRAEASRALGIER